jgi:anti-sigma factor RsiW
MHEEMRTLLNAYLDGELHEQRLREMETHLVSCAACQNELKELRLVSELLRADPAPEFTPAERIVSQMTLRLPRPVLEPGLPRRTLRDRPPKPSLLAWWLVPAGLLGAWFFVQTVFTLTDLVTAANMTGLLGHAAGWLGSGQETIWFSMATSLFSGQAIAAQPTLSVLNNVSIFGANLLSGFLWQAVIVLLYWAWLFFWWLRRHPRPMKIRNAS